MFQLAGGFRCFFDRNMRSDPVIFEFAKSLRLPDANLAERLAHARELFKATDRIPDTVLALSNEKRMWYNREVNEKKRNELQPKDAVCLEF